MQHDRAGVAHGVGVSLVQHRDIVAGRQQAVDEMPDVESVEKMMAEAEENLTDLLPASAEPGFR